MKNFALFGIGPLSTRVYLSFLKANDIKLKLAVDLRSCEYIICDKLNKRGFSEYVFYGVADDERDNDELSNSVKRDLNELIKRHNINYAIIATEPKSHYAYAKFLIEIGLNILLEKPIVAVKDSIWDSKAINKMMAEVEDLYYSHSACDKKLCVMTQRRYHEGYRYVKRIIDELILRFNVGITSITINACDGMWNMPNELSREYHPYKYGYGKLFHSGYHHIDLLQYYLSCNSALKGKKIDSVKIYSTAYRPRDFLHNIGPNEYAAIFGERRFNTFDYDVSNYGELDIHSVCTFYDGDNINCIATVNLMQAGFSRRAWMDLPDDVYKGNGRIKHELVDIEVGPLMAIKVISYQAKVADEGNKGVDLGDNDHFEIQIYRNAKITGGKPLEVIRISDIMQKDEDVEDYNVGSRKRLFEDFAYGSGKESDFSSHYSVMKMMSLLYQSLAEKRIVADTFSPYEKPHRKALLFFDSEGTIKDGNAVSENVSKEIDACKKEGIIAVLSTGLPLYIAKNIAQVCYADIIVATGGAQIYDYNARQNISFTPISSVAIKYFVENIPAYVDMAITCRRNNYSTNINDTISEMVRFCPISEVKNIRDICQIRFRIHQINALDDIDEVVVRVCKMGELLFGGNITVKEHDYLMRAFNAYQADNSRFINYYNAVMSLYLKRFMQKITSDIDSLITIHNRSKNLYTFNSDTEITWFTVVDVSVNKGEAIKIVKDYFARGDLETIAVGNSYNDVSMLKVADLAICVDGDVSDTNSIHISKRNLADTLADIRQGFASGASVAELAQIIRNRGIK